MAVLKNYTVAAAIASDSPLFTSFDSSVRVLNSHAVKFLERYVIFLHTAPPVSPAIEHMFSW
jgi:hypothetical protein